MHSHHSVLYPKSQNKHNSGSPKKNVDWCQHKHSDGYRRVFQHPFSCTTNTTLSSLPLESVTPSSHCDKFTHFFCDILCNKLNSRRITERMHELVTLWWLWCKRAHVWPWSDRLTSNTYTYTVNIFSNENLNIWVQNLILFSDLTDIYFHLHFLTYLFEYQHYQSSCCSRQHLFHTWSCFNVFPGLSTYNCRLCFFFQESGGRQSQGEVGLQQHVLGTPQKPRLHQYGTYSEPVVANGFFCQPYRHRRQGGCYLCTMRCWEKTGRCV